ncbi:DUF6516 family protein [uncultured Thiodictyon sp.]|uniref:toxin-antitoxin system TumE family protein n=1 Tax=uncultured Thiodictyon sp. TaxID=1846217 RepID=UPI0025D0D844|nr:DUF6516 family protein [uncultured Thiodictyon sp.]
MSEHFRTPEDYELFLYTLAERFTAVRRSTLRFIRRGATLARVAGEREFDHGLRLTLRERITFDRLPLVIDWYGYEIWKGNEKLYWYDSQPHPDEPLLQSTHPHHRHSPPDIKHNRAPAPGMSFVQPNLLKLIPEIEALLCDVEK